MDWEVLFAPTYPINKNQSSKVSWTQKNLVVANMDWNGIKESVHSKNKQYRIEE